MAEARRRVESGENSPPPPPPTKPARSGTARMTRATTVDPAATPGDAFGVWRSVQHFCTTDSVPDALSDDLDRLVDWSATLQQFRLRPRIVARLDSGGTWRPVCYAKDGRREPITEAQSEKYRDARLGDSVPSGGAQRALTDADHPEASVSL